jgi:hypothetical protein
MKYFRSLVFLLLAVYLGALPAQPVRAQGTAPVLVYYYVWWTPDAMGPGKTPDWPETPYYSTDASVLEQQVAQAAGAGIDGLVVGWFGPQEEYNQTEPNFRAVLDLAAAHGIKALLSVDLGTAAFFESTQEVIDGLRYAIDVHAKHPAYFRFNGKPLFVFWFQGRYSLEDWAAIRQQVDPNHDTIWIAEGAMPDAMPVFDGLHMYTIAWSENVAGTLAQWGGVTRDRGGIWMATTMPGWDNTYTQQSEKYIREREDGNFYRETFAAAAASGPDMILITSWNEWLEGTSIEPSHNYGDFYLNLTRELIGEYKGSGAVAGGGGSSPPVQQPAQPSGGAANAPDSSGQPAVALTPTPTRSLPPTITPTLSATAASTPPGGSIHAAEGINPGEVLDSDKAEGEALRKEGEAAAISPGSLTLGLGIVAVGIGLLLLSIVGAVFSFRHRRNSDLKKRG